MNWYGAGVIFRGARYWSKRSENVMYPPPFPRTSMTSPFLGSSISNR